MSSLERIGEVIEWYKVLPEDYLDINAIMFKRKELATLLYYMAVEVGDARRAWKISSGQYEMEKNRWRRKMEYKGTTKADWYARANCKDQLDSSIENESVYYSMYYVLTSMKEVLSEMNQRVAHLREEMKNSNYLNG